jgi:hypothetical protein
MLLKMNWSNVDDIVRQFSEDSTWADPDFIALVVATVAGSRKNDSELIEFMMKISDTRGYSAVLERITETERLTAEVSPESEVVNAIIRGCRKSGDGQE